MYKYLLWFWFIVIVAEVLPAQHMLLYQNDTLLNYPRKDSALFQRQMTREISVLVSEGYLEAKASDKALGNDTLFCYQLDKGRKFKNVSFSYLVKEGDSTHRGLKPTEKILQLANKGYPFANFTLSELLQDNGKVFVRFYVNSGPRIYFDSIVGIKALPIKPKAFYNLLGFQPGELYQEKLYQSIPEKLSEIEVISIKDNPDIGFFADKAQIYLDMDVNPASQFDVMVGLQPASGQSNQSRINGYIDVHLPNLFRSAINLDFDWRAFGPDAQSVFLETRIPTLGKTGIGASANLRLLRQDSSFVNSTFGTNIITPITPKAHLTIGYDRTNSSRQSSNLSLFSAVQYDWYKLEICHGCYRSFDTRKRQLAFNVAGGIGAREITEPDDSNENRSISWKGKAELKGSTTLFQNQLFFAGVFAEVLQNRQELLLNEKFRLGGLQTVRGFYENQFFADSYLYMKNEYRLYFEQRSYLFGLADAGWIKSGDFENSFMTPGIGLSLSSNSGIFKFIFARGILFGSGQTSSNLIHFGYTAIF